MNQPMMPPPLPGYNAAAGAGGYPMPAPQAAPQGYPGPAVAAPLPPPPPVPTAQPAAPAPYPAYAQQPAAAPAYAPQAPAPVQHAYNPGAVSSVGDIGAAIAAATGGDRAPRFKQGSFDAELLESIVTKHPVEQYLTFKARFKILASNIPDIREGEERVYIEGLAYGAGRIKDCLIALSGYPSEAEYNKVMFAHGRDPQVELRLLSNACGNPTNQQDGNHYPPNPLAGRRVRIVVSEQDKLAGPRSRNAGKMVHVINHVWSPVA